jgi:exonuclease SbcC
MILRKIILKNIRSYIDGEINFPLGSTLLAGDIGAGKSTLLLAIDFALFGVRRGELSGNALLRNGADNGFVNLSFSINNKEISIKRTLKRSTTGVNQDSCYLTTEDVTQELTALEIKQRILSLLNYPMSELTKKSLTYRYTVYTPQEEMKMILLGEEEFRVETLRKVFNIDKYKRIVDNTKIILSELKSKKKELQLRIADLDTLKLRLKENFDNAFKINENLNTNVLRLQTLDNLLVNKKLLIGQFESDISKLNNLKKQYAVVLNEIKSKEDFLLRNQKQINLFQEQINGFVITEVNIEEIKLKLSENDKLILKFEDELKLLNNSLSQAKYKKENSLGIISKVNNLDSCPLCKQNVSSEYKHSVIENENTLIFKIDKEIQDFLLLEKELLVNLKSCKDNLNQLKSLEKQHEMNLFKLNEVKNKKNLIETLDKDLINISDNLNKLNEDKIKLDIDIVSLKDIETHYSVSKKEFDELNEQKRKMDIDTALQTRELDALNKNIGILNEEILNKEKIKIKLEYYMKLQDWLENYFINVVELMEKKIMARIYVDFNIIFQKWFNLLVNTDMIRVRLDERFTPLIEQNGHDIEYENLSGGEKTACALAYRLALNQIINSLVTNMNAKDLLILDEPTDGFSSEQLDKMREILNELKMNQIIIVSHELKMESFVDHIIRIGKDGHESRVLV